MVYWEYPTNFSNGTSITGLGKFMEYSNLVTYGTFAYGFLIVIFMIVFSAGVMMDSRKSILSASFVTFIFSVYFLRLSLINPVVTIGLLVAIVLGIIMNMGGSKSGI